MAARPYLVGIAGGSGSGKTSLIRALGSRWPDGHVSVVSQDNYYHPRHLQVTDENGRVNYDLPTAVDLDALCSDLAGLRQGLTIARAEYTFNQEGREPAWVEVRPAPLVLVEGLFVLHHAALRSSFDLRVFVDADEEIQLSRRLRRDEQERGYGHDEVMYQWTQHVLPAYRTWLEPYRTECEVQVHNGSVLLHAVDHLHQILSNRLPATEELNLAASYAPSDVRG